MTKRDALEVALKVTGVVFMYQGLLYVIMGLSGLADMSFRIEIVWPLFGSLLFLAAAYVLLRWGDGIAAALIREDGQIPMPESSGQERHIFALAVKVVGVVWLAKGLSQVPRFVVSAIVAGRRLGPLNWYELGGFVSTLAGLALGVYLLAGGKHLVAFAFKERGAESGTGEGPAGQV